MAAPPASDGGVQNMDEEMNSAVEADECSATESEGEPGGEDEHSAEPETRDIFKKPALFAAPSLTGKRPSAAPRSRPAPGDTPSPTETDDAGGADATTEEAPGPVGENGTSGKGRDAGKGDATDENVVPVKSKTEAKARALPSREPLEAKARALPSRGPLEAKCPPIPYTEPPWGGDAPDTAYSWEILKNGTIVDTVPLTQRSYFVVGRLPVCDVSLEHPSISRYHAVIQYRRRAGGGGSVGESVGEEAGFYIHDLGSTHGTVVNKNKIPPKTYVRLRVGHVVKFGGSTRLFILQGPEFDEEAESELTVTELRERAQKQKALLERRMMGDGSDEEEEEEEEEVVESEGETNKGKGKPSNEDSGCSWGMDEEAVPEEDENEENPFSTEFHEDQEAAYLKDPKKALQGFYDREGEELEFEYEDQNHGTWLCRIKLPVDDAMGKQLVAEVTHTGKKKEAAIQCCLEACRMLEARGLLRQEAVSRKRKKKNWEDDDYYDSDDDTFLDRTGTVEKKRQERMKKAGKIEERPETYESLVSKLAETEKELAETQKKLSAARGDSTGSSTEDPLDAFMTAVRSEAAMDAVERRKLHLHIADLRKDAQKLRKLVDLTRPTQLPSLLPSGSSDAEKQKKVLPLFGAMKGGSKFKLKTGTIGKIPPKPPSLPAELFNMKSMSPGREEEEEEEEEEEVMPNYEDNGDGACAAMQEMNVDSDVSGASTSQNSTSSGRQGRQAARSREPKEQSHKESRGEGSSEAEEQLPQRSSTSKTVAPSSPGSRVEGDREPAAAAEPSTRKNVKRRMMGPSKPPVQLSEQYPEDDPDYCVWMPPAGQTGDGRTALNDKYGY